MRTAVCVLSANEIINLLKTRTILSSPELYWRSNSPFLMKINSDNYTMCKKTFPKHKPEFKDVEKARLKNNSSLDTVVNLSPDNSNSKTKTNEVINLNEEKYEVVISNNNNNFMEESEYEYFSDTKDIITKLRPFYINNNKFKEGMVS
jgi:hypothetical protein